MKTRLPLLLCFILSSTVFAQLPDTDIFLVDMKQEKDSIVFGKPANITKRKGYDNQPYFTHDDKSLYYVAIDSTQSDVYRYSVNSGKSQRITNTPESEYSPTPSADSKMLTVVRVDKDSGQRAYRIPIATVSSPELIKGTDSIGYFCRVNDSTLAMFILGEQNTLQLLNLKTNKKKTIAADIGRCMKMNSDGSKLYFVLKKGTAEWRIYALTIKGLDLNYVTTTYPGAEDFALLEDGTLLMGQNGVLYSFLPGKSEEWKKVADFSASIGSFYRIVVNHSETKIAVVGFTGKKP